MGSVGIIGGGISGLSLACALEKSSTYSISLYDTGSRAFGGRASSRKLEGIPVDHSVQFFIAKDPQFQKQTEDWENHGVVQKWTGSIGTLNADSSFTSFQDQLTRYIGSSDHGIQAISTHMAAQLKRCKLYSNVWVSPNNGLRHYEDGRWGVWVNNKEVGRHDMVVIAHNGKCADRITNSTPARRVNKLLQVTFSDKPNPSKMTLNAVYSLVVEVDKKVFSNSFEGVFLSKSSVVSWMACNSRKYNQPGPTEIWTMLSTPAFAKKHKVPQEHLKGTDTEQLVVEAMVTEALSYMGRGVDGVDPRDLLKNFKLQLWGAGVPTNVWNSADQKKFIWDPQFKIGCVGDWLATPSIEGAWLSGLQLGQHLGDQPRVEVGLEGRFVPAGDSSGIGDIGVEVMRPEYGGLVLRDPTVPIRGRGGFSRVQGRGGGFGKIKNNAKPHFSAR
eukprot:GFUD01020253.1.p1 GENE.GFUD01020253.1~~GFUD01020253.1.p1  ORF type:complete len:443 (+),score=103.74 GFUD01020253.1:78-1406(+)